MMNKALEIIEARWLFDTFDIDYVVHKESVIHSMVEFVDGAVLAQMSYPSMEYPIQLALTYPERLPTSMPRYDFSKPLTFLPPDEEVFPFPRLAKEALKTHEGAPLVLNAANEAAVGLFLNKAIKFTHIFDIVGNVLSKADFPAIDTKESVIAAHDEFYRKTVADYKSFI
jgi:1-deoxy-D-xylulose-5-phosphate reductoisomerase